MYHLSQLQPELMFLFLHLNCLGAEFIWISVHYRAVFTEKTVGGRLDLSFIVFFSVDAFNQHRIEYRLLSLTTCIRQWVQN
jgi:hypothetical protein